MSNTIICLEKSICDQVEILLKQTEEVSDAGPHEVLFSVSSKVEGPPHRNGLEVDIKVVNSDAGPYVDAVLFENGREIYALEPSFDKLRGDYLFELDGHQIKVQVLTN